MSLLDPQYLDPRSKDDEGQFGLQHTLLDVMHHDAPERHVIGGTLLAPNITRSIGGTAGPGKSQAPAREDHVHGLDPVTFPAPLGRVAVGTVGAQPVNVPVNTATALTSDLSFTGVTGRKYRAVFIARAIGPQTNGQGVACSIRINGGTAIFDHWFWASAQWSNLHISAIFTYVGAFMGHVDANISNGGIISVYPTEWYVEDIGKV